jgi:hypothetical protein
MTTDRDESLLGLIERANRIGSLLPKCVEDVDLDDPAALADLVIVLLEFDKVRTAIEVRLTWPTPKPSSRSASHQGRSRP